jgi:hypothetical protein
MTTYKVIRVDVLGTCTEIFSIDLPAGERLLSYKVLPSVVGAYNAEKGLGPQGHYVWLDRENDA